MTEFAVLCPVPAGLADHVVQLLADADVTGRKAVPKPGSPGAAELTHDLFIVVPSEDLDRARSVIGLVLPQLLNPQQGSSGLSEQLVRSESPDDPKVDPLPVWRGPANSVLDEPSDDLHDDEGNFVPPAPPPVPRPQDRIARFAWAAVIGGPLLTIVALVLDLDGLFTIAGLALFFAGFATLIARAPERRMHEGPDNGAVL